MRAALFASLLSLLGCGGGARLASPPSPASLPSSKHVAAESSLYEYEVVSLADGIYAFVPAPGRVSLVTGNMLVVIGGTDVLVLDTGHFPSLARKMIADIRRLTPKPVKYVVTSHWHPDHLFGNAAFREAYPDVVFVGHSETRRLAIAKDPEFIAAQRDAAKKIAKYEAILAKKELKPGVPLGDLTRTEIVLTLPEMNATVDDSDVTLVPPELTFDGESLRIDLGGREVRVLHLGRGNTAGDAMVYVPDANVLATGDAVVAPVPYSYGSYIGEWQTVLRKVSELRPRVLLPGHGSVQHNLDYVGALSSLLAALQQQVESCAKQGLSLDETRKKVDLASFRDAFAGPDATQQLIFDVAFVEAGVGRAYEEAKGAISEE
jgi:glyoxylase-like metal-dependent hydrolase (beta-lactamase superfamily II)